MSFESFWDQSVHDGVFTLPPKPMMKKTFSHEGTRNSFPALSQAKPLALTLLFYQKVGVLEGQHANNPWLQELPDPVSKIVWDNYVTLSPSLARQYYLKQGDFIKIKTEKGVLELPVCVLPGQAAKTMGVALGYGRTEAGRVGNKVGRDVYPWVSYKNGIFEYQLNPIEIEKTGERKKLACTQVHQSMEGRPIIRETLLEDYLKNPKAGNEELYDEHSLWKEHKKEGSFWGMAIDLNACTGCGACVVACQAENNIPSVGQQEVAKNREMHWIRIDRYYTGPDEKPEVVHQPMLCQHCEHAPCETVCPTLATTHSVDGLNMQTYNRCVGTRYCANNCPYKVRRFNWFNYSHSDLLANMVLNPDVVVRSRGIMEKCTMCVQRIQEKEGGAKSENRRVRDGEIKTACQQSCPADAIVFGDLNDPQSQVTQMKKNPRNYRVLAELKTLPTVSYLTKIRNKKSSEQS